MAALGSAESCRRLSTTPRWRRCMRRAKARRDGGEVAEAELIECRTAMDAATPSATRSPRNARPTARPSSTASPTSTTATAADQRRCLTLSPSAAPAADARARQRGSRRISHTGGPAGSRRRPVTRSLVTFVERQVALAPGLKIGRESLTIAELESRPEQRLSDARALLRRIDPKDSEVEMCVMWMVALDVPLVLLFVNKATY